MSNVLNLFPIENETGEEHAEPVRNARGKVHSYVLGCLAIPALAGVLWFLIYLVFTAVISVFSL